MYFDVNSIQFIIEELRISSPSRLLKNNEKVNIVSGIKNEKSMKKREMMKKLSTDENGEEIDEKKSISKVSMLRKKI